MKRRRAEDVAAEIASHLAHEADEAGSAAAAERAFGNTLQVREKLWDASRWWPAWVRAAGRDLRLGLRRVRRSPGPSLAALAVLGLALAAALVVYAAANLLVLGGLPYAHADQLMLLRTATTPPAGNDQFSAPDFADLQRGARSFAGVAGLSPVWDIVTDAAPGQPAERIPTLFVSASLGPVLGIRPRLGRWFTPAEDHPGAPQAVAVISDRLWRQGFAGRADVIGQHLNINQRPVTIIGVLAPDFRYLGEPVAGTAVQIDLWAPLALNPLMQTPRTLRWLNLVARRRAGVTAEQAASEVAALGGRLAQAYPAADGGLSYSAASLAAWVEAPHRPAMLMLLAAVGLLLLLACASVANLLVEQALARRPEMAMRRTLGASRGRLLRQLASEHLALAACGTALGLAGAWAGMHWLAQLAPRALFDGRALSLNGRVLAVAGGALLATALGFGIAPAWTTLHPRAATPHLIGGGLGRLRAALVAAQIALALALLIGAGLLLEAFLRVIAVAPGFDATHTVTVSTQLPVTASTPALRRTADLRLAAQLSALPDIGAVGLVSRLPLSGKSLTSELWIEGRPYPPGQQPEVEYRVATSGYFTAMGIPVVSGRGFMAGNDTEPARGDDVWVNQTAARQLWPAGNAVGRRVQFGANPSGAWSTIVGVVGDVKAQGLDDAARPTVFRPLAHSALSAPIVVARAKGDPAAALGELTAAIHRFDPSLPVYNQAAMAGLLSQSLAQRRLLLVLLALFAATGTLVAVVGVYASMAQSVVRRRRELGLRLALGAPPVRLGGSVMAQSLRVTLAGLAAGTLLALALSRLLRGLLFETSPLAPAIYLCTGLALGGVALLAALLPALRAARTPAATALREL